MLALRPLSPARKRDFFERSSDFVAGREPELVVPRWSRALQLGVDPHGAHALEEAVLGSAGLRDARERIDPIWRGASAIVEDFAATCSARDFVMLLADAEGVVTHAVGGGGFKGDARRLRLIEGARWGEDLRGTNAIGTALVEGEPVAVHGAAHYARVNEGLVCFAAPLRDPFGKIVGVLDASSYAERAEAFDPRVLLTVVRAIEDVVRARSYAGVRGGLDLIERLLDHSGKPAFLVERPGRIVRSNAAGRAFMDVSRPGARVLPSWEELERIAASGRGGVSVPAKRGRRDVRELAVEPITDARDRVLALAVFFGAHAPAAVEVRPARPPRGAASAAFDALLGDDPALCEARSTCARLARSALPVLLLGETGTGKELFARAIHDASPRSSGPFVAINCGAIQPELLLSELFGHGPGAFTGAAPRGRDGMITAAHGGTLFLDEVAEMSTEAQVALLRVLEDGSYARVGETETRRADIRIVAATCRDLRALLDAGQFRQDLYFRIGGSACVELPALRERADLDALVDALWLRRASAADDGAGPLSQATRAALRAHAWPGNVRELKAALDFAAVLGGGAPRVEPEHLPPALRAQPGPRARASEPAASAREGDALESTRRSAVQAALRAAGGNVSAAARRLGVARSTIYRMLRRWKEVEAPAEDGPRESSAKR